MSNSPQSKREKHGRRDVYEVEMTDGYIRYVLAKDEEVAAWKGQELAKRFNKDLLDVRKQ
ncbi:MAG: hypothetical protein CL779_02600 [Chloroflexi bacterium]|nr:hypothetical protein [Chloroflexota bacterium]